MARNGLVLSAPTQAAWVISLIVGLLGIAGHLTAIPFVSVNAFWFVVGAFLLLTLATLLKRL